MRQHPEASCAQGLGCSRARASLSACAPMDMFLRSVFGGHSSALMTHLGSLGSSLLFTGFGDRGTGRALLSGSPGGPEVLTAPGRWELREMLLCRPSHVVQRSWQAGIWSASDPFYLQSIQKMSPPKNTLTPLKEGVQCRSPV